MHIKHKCLIWIFISYRIFAADPDQHPELISQSGMDALSEEGKLSFRLSFNDEIDYRFKMGISCGYLQLDYLNEGNGSKIQHTASLGLTSKYFELGWGRGSPHIGRGLIVGSTMMRFSSDPNTNIGYCRSKIKIRNYSYNHDLVYIKGNYRAFSLGGFRYRDVSTFLAEYSEGSINGACVVYLLDKPLMEMYSAFHNDAHRASINMSLFKKRLNHFCTDYIYKNDRIKLFASLVHCDKEYVGVNPDSKWGSCLEANSTGYAAGYYLTLKKFKIYMSSIRLRGNEYREDKIITDIIYKNKSTEIGLSANYRNRNELTKSTNIPQLLDWEKKNQALLKIKLKGKPISGLAIMAQFQMNAFDLYAYSGIIRLAYNIQFSKLILQISQASSSQSDLYYLRPLSASTYSIRKAGQRGVFYDFVFEKQFNKVKIGVLLRSEGVSLNVKL